jgi:hypothetical protein
VAAAALDVVAVVVFVAIGRASHAHGDGASGILSTSWPFLAGVAVGWIVARAWRRPLDLVPTALMVWLACVGLGMVLRVVAGQGTAVAFIAVALGFLGLELLGWRVLARAAGRWGRTRSGAGAGPDAHP